jgi:hypothetical protein
MKFNTLISSVFILTTTAASAYAGVKIHGKITDENNEPLEFVTIQIDGTAIATSSGIDGLYSLSAPDSDTIRVVFKCIGYQESKRRLVSAKDDVTLNVKMEPAAYTLQSINVTEYQKQTNTIQKIDKTDYKLAPDVNGGSVDRD